MDDDLYDEFGNYIGPDLNENGDDGDEIMGEDWINEMHRLQRGESSDHSDMEHVEPIAKDSLVAYQGKKIKGMYNYINYDSNIDINDDPNQNAIVLHEDKQYYQDAEEVFKGAEVLVQEEDAIPITTPMIAPAKKHDFDAQEKEIPKTSFNFEFFGDLSNKPDRIRNLAICGHLHHGKTLVMDMFVQATHERYWDPEIEHKYTDTRKDEKERKMSIKSMPMSFVLQSSREKSYLVNLIDTPGHPNFVDEVATSIRIADGVILVVDVIEGVTLHTESIIKHALDEELQILLIVNKLDRLVLELKLPPSDAYLKIRRTIEKVNHKIKINDHKKVIKEKLSPQLGNVIFSSGLYGWAFTLKSFAQIHLNIKGDRKSQVDPDQFSRFLWGDVYFDEETRKFAKKPPRQNCERTFVHFILEPFYKLVGYTVSEEKDKLQSLLSKMQIYLNKKEYNLDVKALLKIVLSRRFGRLDWIIDSIVQYIPSAKDNNLNKMKMHYLGDFDSDLCQRYSKCSSKEPLLINIVKLYHQPDYSSFDVFGRIFSGSLKPGDTVKILDENYTASRPDENMTINEVTGVFIYQSRYKISTNKAWAGSWVLISGIDKSIMRSATVLHAENEFEDEEINCFEPINFKTESVIKIACESWVPSEHPKMQEGLTKVNKSYPLAEVKVEESGEHLIIGTGELYLDCILHDLRRLYSEIEIKVSDPSVRFCETVVSTSAFVSTCESANKENAIRMIAEVLDGGLAEQIESKTIDITWPEEVKRDYLVKNFKWDELTASSLWAFGPDINGPNALIDYTLRDETDYNLLNSSRDKIVHGFKWAVKEGPLWEEPVRGCKFKIMNAEFSDKPIQRGGGQIIPMSRSWVYSSFLTATPRLMEPLYVGEIFCPEDWIEPIYNVLLRRRAHVVHQEALDGSPLHVLQVEIPAIESFGFETDLRTYTVGQSFVLSHFLKWSLAPGDPLDKSIQLKILEPNDVSSLAREFMVKTRRRKGLVDEVNVAKFFEHEESNILAKEDRDLKHYFI